MRVDKIAETNVNGGGAGVSREGVQRDILPIVEGSVVKTKYGPIKTDHILFIAAGAFHVSKPEDLISRAAGAFFLTRCSCIPWTSTILSASSPRQSIHCRKNTKPYWLLTIQH